MSSTDRRVCWIVVAVACGALAIPSSAVADPCGMVPPIYLGNDAPIARIGDQQTYVFFKNGIETVVIRPGFSGKVDEFGMLIPFPSVPSLRKVPDHIFPHVAAAIDPPEIVIDLRWAKYAGKSRGRFNKGKKRDDAQSLKLAVPEDKVRVVKQEAVGMYEVAVLEAGSARALKKWIDEHGYQYPKGMDGPANEYVKSGWCFVAVKTRVGPKSGVNPKPGMRRVNSKMPAGATFGGSVQAMGFRFESDRLVVPMRLSTYNAGELHNIVYVLTDGPTKIRSVPEEYVVRQLSGKQLIGNVTNPLPLRLIGGTAKDIQPWQKRNLKQRRDPKSHNGAARDLFAADLLAVSRKQLSHPHEETEKMYLRIGERLGLRGADIDKLNTQALEADREKVVKTALKQLDGMTLTVINGNFPREVLANQNLTFAPYRMPSRRNRAQHYDAKSKKPARTVQGTVVLGSVSALDPPSRPQPASIGRNKLAYAAAGSMFLALGCVVFLRRRR